MVGICHVLLVLALLLLLLARLLSFELLNLLLELVVLGHEGRVSLVTLGLVFLQDE